MTSSRAVFGEESSLCSSKTSFSCCDDSSLSCFDEFNKPFVFCYTDCFLEIGANCLGCKKPVDTFLDGFLTFNDLLFCLLGEIIDLIWCEFKVNNLIDG